MYEYIWLFCILIPKNTMAISSIKELKKNGEYYMTLVKDGQPFKVRLLGIVQEFGTTELYVNAIKKTKRIPINLNIIDVGELGVGDTEDEANRNYSKLKHTPIESAYKSQELLEKEIVEIKVNEKQNEFFNLHGVDRSQLEIV